MTVKVMREQEVLQEAAKVLLKYLEPAKVARFWAAWQVDGGTIWRFVRNCSPERRWPLSMIKFWPIKGAPLRSNCGGYSPPVVLMQRSPFFHRRGRRER